MITFRCPHCYTDWMVDASKAGTEVTCEDCGQVIQLPDPKRPLPALPPAPPERPMRVFFGSGKDSTNDQLILAIVVAVICGVVLIGGSLLEKFFGK